MFGSRQTRAGRRARGRRTTVQAGIGLVTAGIIITFGWIAEHAYNGIPFVNYQTVYVSIPDIGHLQQHDPVEIAGVRVGQVLDTSLQNNRAFVKLQLQGVGPLPVDTTAEVRADGLLGEREVQLIPGSDTRYLRDGATINSSTADYTWGVPETLSLFDPKTRTAIGEMLNGVGQGLIGRGEQLGQAIGTIPPSASDFDVTADAILARTGAVDAFLPSTDAGVTALDSARDDIAGMLKPASQGLQPFVDERAATDQALSDAPSTLSAINADFGQPAQETLSAANALADSLDHTLPAAPSGLRAATHLLLAAPDPLVKARLVLSQIPHAVPATLGILSALKPNLTPLHKAFVNLVDPVTQLAIHGCDLQAFATNTRSLVNFGALPGTNYGPAVGFPLGLIFNPGEMAANFINTGRWAVEQPYPSEPCEYTPGPTLPESTILQVLGGALR